MLLLWIYILCRGRLELEKERWPTLLKAATGAENTYDHYVISLQKSYNGRKHNNKVALLLGEFAAYEE